MPRPLACLSVLLLVLSACTSADDKIAAPQKINAGYIKRVIPKGTYPGVDYDVPVVSYFAHLVVSAKLPDDLVYNITKTFAKNLPRFADVVKDMKGVTAKDLALERSVGCQCFRGII